MSNKKKDFLKYVPVASNITQSFNIISKVEVKFWSVLLMMHIFFFKTLESTIDKIVF